MKRKLPVAILLLLAAVGTAFAAGPEDTVEKLAVAVEDKDGRAFMGLVDLDALLDAEPALYDSDAMYLGSSNSSKHDLEDEIASGVLALQCKETRKPGCAWTVDGLKKPLIRTRGGNSAVVAVDNPQGIRTWIALHQGSDGWKVVGVAAREREAETYASEDFQKKRETYRTNRVAREKDTEKRQALEAFAAERKREDDRKKLLAEMARNREILATVKLSGITVEHRTNAGYDGRQHELVVRGTVVNRYGQDVTQVRWRLDFVDGNGSGFEHITWMDTNMGDKTLLRGVSYQRKWNLSLKNSELVKAGEQYTEGQCTITIRPDMLYVGDTFVSDQDRVIR
jgi:hypothetical protein